MPVQRAARGIVYRAMGMVSLALGMAIAKTCMARGVPVFEIVLARNLFAFLPFGILIWAAGGVRELRTRRPLGHLLRGLLGVVGLVLAFSALRDLPLTEATALQFTTPLFMTALSALVLHEHVGRHRWAAVVVGFVGVLFMIRPEPGHMSLTGGLLGLGGAVASAGAVVAIRQLAAERPSAMLFYNGVSGVALGLAGTLFHWVIPDSGTMLLLVLIGLISGVGHMFLTQSVRLAPLGVIAPADYTQLIWAALLAFVIWGDLPRMETLVGAAIVAASGLYILHRELSASRAAAAKLDSTLASPISK